MVFIPPNWFTGMIMYGLIYILPILLGVGIIILGLIRNFNMKILAIGIVICFISVICSSYITHEMFETPSVQEEIITVQGWQPKPNIQINENGMMVINSADDLMLITKDGKSFLNEENFWFQKFNTRDIFNDLKVNGTYKIKYYGWREGFNSGFPNILSIEEVIDENNTSSNNYDKYFGNQLVVN